LKEETSSSCFGGVGRAPPLHIPVKRAKKRPKRSKSARNVHRHQNTPGLNEDGCSPPLRSIGWTPPPYIPVRQAKKRPKRVKKAPQKK
jgi:hypothetical protein